MERFIADEPDLAAALPAAIHALLAKVSDEDDLRRLMFEKTPNAPPPTRAHAAAGSGRSVADPRHARGYRADMSDREPLGHRSPPEREKEGAERLATVLAPKIDALCARIETIPRVADGSILSDDDQASRPFQVSHIAWHSLTHSVDNLRALRVLTVQGEYPDLHVTTHPYAAYPLLRAAIENASTTVWVLAPDDRDTRLTRRFRLALQNARHGDDAAAILGLTATAKKDHADRLRVLLADLPLISMSACRKQAGFALIVREAAEGYGSDPDTAEVIWRLLSALTHGDQWATATFTDRDEVEVSEDGKVVTMETTSSLANIANMTNVAVLLAEAAFRLWDMRTGTR